MDISLDFDLTTLAIQIAATLLLFAVVAKFFAKPMKNFLAKRQEYVQETFDEAEQAKLAASQTKEELDEQLGKLKAESRQMLDEAAAKAQVKADSILEEAKADAAKAMEAADVRNERERTRMIKSAQAEITEITTKATEKLIKKEIDASAHDDLFDEFVKLVGGADE